MAISGEAAIESRVTENRGTDGPGQRMQAKLSVTGATSWNIISKIAHGSKIVRGLLQW